jgi:predicted Zn-dependent protease
MSVVGAPPAPSIDGAKSAGTTQRGGFVYHTVSPASKIGASGAATIRTVSFLEADTGALARCLVEVSADPAALVEAFFERTEQTVLAPRGQTPAHRVWREEGFSIRLVSSDQTWMVSRDGIDGSGFLEALRKTARRMAQGLRPPPRLRAGAWPEGPALDAPRAFVSRVETELRRRHLAFPLRLEVRHHRRFLQIVSRELVTAPEAEDFWSVRADLDGASWGSLLPSLDGDAAAGTAGSLSALFRSRDAPAPAARRADLLLGASAAAVLLHEAVAHALEVDTLALTGDPASVVGHRVASAVLDLLDDPTGGPSGLRRATDDEGVPVLRRWLLRRGVVEQPLADRRWARRSPSLHPGAGRRQSRHWAPAPRSLHLELLPGAEPLANLAATLGDGLFAAEAKYGFLDPLSGRFELHFPHGRRLRGGRLDERVGPFRLRGAVGDLLDRIASAGREVTLSGAGWCAKGGQRLPVWSTTPGLLLQGVEVSG